MLLIPLFKSGGGRLIRVTCRPSCSPYAFHCACYDPVDGHPKKTAFEVQLNTCYLDKICLLIGTFGVLDSKREGGRAVGL